MARNQRRLIAAWVLAVVAILPILFRWQAPAPATGPAAAARVALGSVAALFLCYRMYRAERARLARRDAVLLVCLVVLFAAIASQLHSVNVDDGRDYFDNTSNAAWQVKLHNDVLRLDPAGLPHTYRFLPNAIVRWMEIAGLDFETARDLYRLLCGLPLFYALYRFARLFTTHVGGVLAMSLAAIIVPVSYENYAGQLTDPLSHLSFVLAFIFIETGEFGYLITTVLLGSLAKESVLALAVYYILFRGKEKGYRWKAAAMFAGAAAIFAGVRWAVLGGPLRYAQVSGGPPHLVRFNLTDGRWPVLFLLTAGAFLPFLVLGWKETPATLQRLALFLLPVLWLSSTFFGFLAETRNFMPVVFVLAVVAARQLSAVTERFRLSPTTP